LLPLLLLLLLLLAAAWLGSRMLSVSRFQFNRSQAQRAEGVIEEVETRCRGSSLSKQEREQLPTKEKEGRRK